MVNNSTNINKTCNHLSPQPTTHKLDIRLWRSKSLVWNIHKNVAGKVDHSGLRVWRVSCSRPLLYISKKSRCFVTATKTKGVVHTQFSILFYWQSRFVTQAGPPLSHFYLALPDTLLSLFSF